ncbi:FkbM family methyltransferase [Azospirillum brasilense]|uniref:FkbM family methyltransferase n=1 Tax=Azospirillum brasilense TaxID=192 RepID=UPI000E0A2B61|nr:FkbM family methyltransferase [Azospirillum brasilense]
MLSWKRDSGEILDRIGRYTGTMKIVLKTLDDPVLLERWLSHHIDIVGPENIIIADNGSTDETVLDVYDRYKSDILVFQFEGFHNKIHDRSCFNALYEGLGKSGDYVLFLDTDEMLVRFDGSRWHADSSIVEYVQSISPTSAIPTTWIHNAQSSDRIFSVGTDQKWLRENLKWGKPIVPSSFMGAGINIHNSQFPVDCFKVKVGTDLFLLHLTKLSAEQRLRTNRNKLAARGFARKDESYEDIVARDRFKGGDPTVVRCVDEIEVLLKERNQPVVAFADVPKGHLELMQDGTIRFAGFEEEKALQAFLEDGHAAIQDSLNLPRPSVNPDRAPSTLATGAETAEGLRAEGLLRRDQGDLAGAEVVLRTGLERFPDQRDQYGHPTFRKELMRLYLQSRRWEEATALISEIDGPRERYWHAILFARAYSHIGELASAEYWWRIVKDHQPDSSEVIDALRTLQSKRIAEGGKYLVRGNNVIRDILNANPNINVRVIFDIGANVGNISLDFSVAFPHARIFSFEPVRATHAELSKRLAHRQGIVVERLALGKNVAESQLVTAWPLSTENQFVAQSDPSVPTDEVMVTTGDSYCLDNGIEEIDYLKVDTEGSDMDVLIGFKSMLQKGKIKFVEVEVGMNRQNKKHVHFVDFVDFIQPLGFQFFGIYEQIKEFDERLALRRANIVFVKC